MLSIFDPLRDVTLLSVAVRMLLAVLCGGAIGIEREYKRRPAGFRTHILICLGAAMVSLTSEFLFLYMKYYLDISRMSAAVASGIGFIGAGTIIVTRRQRVKGLTTAAGLWVAAIIGIAIGSAAAAAADARVDSRVMFSVGRAAKSLGLLGEKASLVLGLPLSISGKSPFFDRKPKK